MAYEQNWKPKDKLTYEDLKEVLTSIVVDITEQSFAIKKSSDDGGSVVEVWIEEGLQGTPNPHLPPQCRGWRVTWVSCPSVQGRFHILGIEPSEISVYVPMIRNKMIQGKCQLCRKEIKDVQDNSDKLAE